ncbi:neuronal acetylcholine receptor subunit alpha-9-I-like [Sinocyclocheilus grahami]|uniref:neuronal acetylcholine receptor subunit alpha-9-I-like n=1 Tax=Sinocyclocheilus grahami TaxID=75366 RepID=UPI0007AD27C0|nr:PREDICTED: neuronal acetylcholine receptor subunit alpha-9-I-like [Sinocyclocheilus grahami]
MKIIFLVIHISMLLHVVFSAQGRFAQKLLNDLMENYSNALRPVEDTDKALNVTLQITLSQIKDMDERNQVLTTYLWVRQIWHDAYLCWDKDEYDGLEVIRIPGNLVWRPDIVLYNNADEEDSSGPPDTNVVLRYNGEITWDSPAITKSSCSIRKYYIATMTMITASTSLTIFIMNIHFCGAEAKPVPHWAKVLIIDYMSKIFFVYEVGENCTTAESDRGPLFSEDPLASLERDGYFDKGFYGDCHHDERNHSQFNGYSHRDHRHGNGYRRNNSAYRHHRHDQQRRTRSSSNSPIRHPKYTHYIGRDGSEKLPLTSQEKLKDSELSIPEKLNGYTYDHGNGYLNGVAYHHDNSYSKTFGADSCNKTTSGTGSVCACGQHQKVVRNIEYIANCFREQRAHQAKGAEWKKVAKVMDRFFMWVFFIMVFLMSILVMAKAT